MGEEMAISIEDAIKKNLPSEVGDVLKARLEQAEKDAESAKYLREQRDELTDRAQSAETEMARLQDQLRGHEDLDKRTVDVTLREKVMELKEGHASSTVGMMQDLVKAVFANNKFKYQQAVNHEVLSPDQDNYNAPKTSHLTSVKTVDSEG